MLLVIFGATASPVRAEVRWQVRPKGVAPFAGPAVLAAAAYLEQRKIQLGLDGYQLQPVAEMAWLDRTNVSFYPRYAGLRVFNSMVKVRVAPDGRVEASVVDLPPSVSPNAVVPAVSVQEAEQAVEDLWARAGRYDLSPIRDVVLGLLPLGGESRLVYRVDVALGWKGHRHFVDAMTGQVILYFERVIHSLGRVYPENPVRTPDTVDATLYNLDDETGPDNRLIGWGGLLQVHRYVGGSLYDWPVQMEQLATGDASGNFLYDATDVHPVYDDPFSEVNAYFHVDRALTYFSDVHGMTFTKTMFVLANYSEDGQPYNNAFFTDLDATSVLMATGQGTSADFGYESDVLFHEFGHFVIDEVAGLNYSFLGEYDEWGRNQMSAGLHEGLADYFSCTISDDGVLGEYSLAPLGGVRDLSDNDQVCPDDMVGEAHIDGEIVGGCSWEIRETVGATRTDDVVFGGLSLLTPNSTFRDFAEGVEASVQTLVDNNQMTTADASTVHDILVSRGMHDCGRYIDVVAGQVRRYTFWGFDVRAAQFNRTCEDIRGFMTDQNGDPFYLPGPFQYRVVVPQDMPDDILRFTMQQTPTGGDLINLITVRKGQMVHYEMVPTGMGWVEMPRPDLFDYETEVTTESEIRITLDTSTTPALEPGAEIYFALGTRNCPITTVEVTITWARHAPQQDAGVDATPDAALEPDAGTGGPGKGGCDCRVSAAETPAAPLVLVLILAVLLLVRKRFGK